MTLHLVLSPDESDFGGDGLHGSHFVTRILTLSCFPVFDAHPIVVLSSIGLVFKGDADGCFASWVAASVAAVVVAV